VTFRFDEPVEGNFGAVRVFDAKGGRVDDNQVGAPPVAAGRS
jgi:copper transport protein